MTAPTTELAKPGLPKRVPDLSLHPYCEIIPPCTAEEFAELKEDIKKYGLQVPIKLFADQILDGRSRYNACVELDKEGVRVEWKSEAFSGTQKDAFAYVISMNVKRRHLTPSQRAIIAAKLVNTLLGGDRSVKLPTEVTQEDVAKLAGVAVKTVTDAKTVLEKSPDLAAQVLKGEMAVSKAAEQVRKQQPGKGKGKRKPKIKKPKTTIEYITPDDGPTALSAYSLLEEHLLDALQDVNDQSSFTHANEYARETIEKLENRLSAMEPQMADAAE